MRATITIILLLLAFACRANMASPIWEGTSGGAAISSKDIDIRWETIHVRIDEGFKTAAYHVEYQITANSAGVRIPLLFYAKNFKDSFKVWVDGHRIDLKEIPQAANGIVNTPFERFDNSFKPQNEGEYGTIEIKWSDRKSDRYKLSDLKYFETDLTKGDHWIFVDYQAEVAVNRTNPVKEYSFDYSLSPAKYWHSFGGLGIVVETKDSTMVYETNLGASTYDSLKTLKKWSLDKLPGEYFRIIYNPKVGRLAKLMMGIGPGALMIATGVLLLLLHVWGIYSYRKRNGKRWSWVVLVGALMVPIVTLLSYMCWDMVIDTAIGPEASGRHGYDFLMVVFYPLVMPAYWLVMWVTDYVLKRKIYGK